MESLQATNELKGAAKMKYGESPKIKVKETIISRETENRDIDPYIINNTNAFFTLTPKNLQGNDIILASSH
jgi:hypothetical protein